MKKTLLYLTFFLFFVYSAISQPINPFAPPEYFPSKSVLVEWDFNYNTWDLYSKLIYEIQEVTIVVLVVRDKDEENTIVNLLNSDGVPLDNVEFVHVPCERMWIRDHGPLSVMTENGVAFMDFNDFADSGLDEDLPTNLGNLWNIQSYQIPWILCGGNFMVDSHNTLFATDRLYSNNSSIPIESIDYELKNYLGIDRIVTVSPQHNDYWGHIDMQMKLLNDTIMIISSVDKCSGPNYDSLENNFIRIKRLFAHHGKPYTIARIPMADNWKTYTNSLIINSKIIVPVYDHPYDEVALSIYQELLPNHKVVGVNCNSIIQWEGALHCITMQLFDDKLITSNHFFHKPNDSFIVFPNPISQNERITVFTNELIPPFRLSIHGINGQAIGIYPIPDHTSSISFSWNYEPGVYFIRIQSNKELYVKKIISQ